MSVSLRNFLLEAIAYNKVKDYLDIERSPVAKKLINDIFNRLKKDISFVGESKRGDRLYFNISNTSSYKGENTPDTRNKLFNLLQNSEEEYSRYASIKSLIQEEGYEWEILYDPGLVKDKKNDRKIKVGKIINRSKKLSNEQKKDYLNFISRILEIVGNKKDKSFYVVISKHRYDLAGMSTDRHWSSCMAIGSLNARVIKCDIKEGTVIAYFIEKDDKNINKPVGRVLIKPYVKLHKDGDDIKDLVYMPEVKTYGSTSDYLKDFLDFTNDLFEKAQPDKKGIFDLIHSLYADDPDESYRRTFNLRSIEDLEPEDYFNIVGINKFRKLSDGTYSVSDIIVGKETPSFIDSVPSYISYIEGDLIWTSENLKSLPDNLHILGDLEFHRNRLKKLPENLYVRGQLNISRSNLEELPESIIVDFESSNSQVNEAFFKCSYTRIKRIPDSLKNITYLLAEESHLEDISNLTNLISLVADGSKNLKYLPDTDSIEYLRIRNTGVEYLPESIFEKGALSSLDLYKTTIKELPKNIILDTVRLPLDSFTIKNYSQINNLINLPKNLTIGGGVRIKQILLNTDSDSSDFKNNPRRIVELRDNVEVSVLALQNNLIEGTLELVKTGKGVLFVSKSLLFTGAFKGSFIEDILTPSHLLNLKLTEIGYSDNDQDFEKIYIPKTLHTVDNLDIAESMFETSESYLLDLLKRVRVMKSIVVSYIDGYPIGKNIQDNLDEIAKYVGPEAVVMSKHDQHESQRTIIPIGKRK